MKDIKDVSAAIVILEEQAWSLHKKLGEVYTGGPMAQYRDMEKLGKLGRQLGKLHEARAIMNMIAMT